jgi:hypothetical protein
MFKELKNCPNIFTVESTFSGVDYGELKGQHVTTQMLEKIGVDLCRSLLLLTKIAVPEELKEQYPSFLSAHDLSSQLANEILQDKKLIKAGEGDSSGGSESEPSEDNMPIEEMSKVIPIIEKTTIKKLEKVMQKKRDEEKEALRLKQLQEKLPKKKYEESPTRPVA